jgi:hypothetical protein
MPRSIRCRSTSPAATGWPDAVASHPRPVARPMPSRRAGAPPKAGTQRVHGPAVADDQTTTYGRVQSAEHRRKSSRTEMSIPSELWARRRAIPGGCERSSSGTLVGRLMSCHLMRSRQDRPSICCAPGAVREGERSERQRPTRFARGCPGARADARTAALLRAAQDSLAPCPHEPPPGWRLRYSASSASARSRNSCVQSVPTRSRRISSAMRWYSARSSGESVCVTRMPSRIIVS